MTSNNETVFRQLPWVGNTAKTMTLNRKQLTFTREMLTAVARYLSIKWLFVFPLFDPFALLYNKTFNDWSLGEQWILFPSNLNVSLDFVSGNIEILGKQNSLFPKGPVIKWLLSAVPLQNNACSAAYLTTITLVYVSLPWNSSRLWSTYMTEKLSNTNLWWSFQPYRDTMHLLVER